MRRQPGYGKRLPNGLKELDARLPTGIDTERLLAQDCALLMRGREPESSVGHALTWSGS